MPPSGIPTPGCTKRAGRSARALVTAGGEGSKSKKKKEGGSGEAEIFNQSETQASEMAQVKKINHEIKTGRGPGPRLEGVPVQSELDDPGAGHRTRYIVMMCLAAATRAR